MMKVVVTLVAVMALQSCILNQKTENEVVIDVDDDFQLRYLENLDTPEDDLIFILESIRNRACERDTVLMKIETFASALRVDIDVVNTPGTCMPGTVPSSTMASTAGMKNDRTALSIHLEDLVDNQGAINKDDKTYSINMETTYGFYFPYETLQRIPRSSIWGYVGFGPNFAPMAQEFLEAFYGKTDAIEVDEGQYGYFSIDKKGDIRIDSLHSLAMYSQPFIRSYNIGDLQAVKGLFADFKEKYPSMRFEFYDGYGNSFR